MSWPANGYQHVETVPAAAPKAAILPARFEIQVPVSSTVSAKSRLYHDHVPVPPEYQHGQPLVPSQYGGQPSANFHQGDVPLQSAHVPAISVETPDPGSRQCAKPAIDYQSLLLALAEDYLGAAKRLGPRAAGGRDPNDLDSYHRLVATSLGCLESVLQRWRLPPHREALIRFKYASTLYEETENYAEAESTLSKGIALCDRNRFTNLKHRMRYLLARVLFVKSRKAAMKYLEGFIADVEAYQDVFWVYACRFLRVSFHLEIGAANGINGALHDLRAVSGIARGRRDDAVVLVAATLEAQVHLLSSHHDSLEQAQRALATARSLQLTDTAARLPQTALSTQMMDLLCSLKQPNPQEAVSKMKELKATIEGTLSDSRWSDDGSILVPVSTGQTTDSILAHGGVNRSVDVVENLVFSWLPKRHIHMLGYFLCGVTTSQISSGDTHVAEQHYQRALWMAESRLTDDQDQPQSICSAAAQRSWRRQLARYVRMHLALSLCCRAQWARAKVLLEELQEVDGHATVLDGEPLSSLVQYVTGVVHQGSGNFSGALSVFGGSAFDMQAKFCREPSDSTDQIRRDLTILAHLNSILILHQQPNSGNVSIPALIASLDPLCGASSNRNIQAATNLIRACVADGETMIVTKRYLEQALPVARQMANTQLTCMALNLVGWKFLRGVISEQAEKGARAALSTAKNSNNRLWLSVSTGLLADTLEVQGKLAEAQATRAEAMRLAELATSTV